VNHFVAECPENVLDVPVVYEQNQLVVGWVIVSRLDEKFVLWIWGLVKNNLWHWFMFKTNLLEILDDFLNPEVEHVYLVFVVHDRCIYHTMNEMVNSTV